MMGEGIAVIPEDGKVYAPCSGTVIVVPPTKHAIGIKTKGGIEVLVHVGLESEKIDGQFTCKYKEGDKITQGDIALTFDFNALKEIGYDMTTPVIITNSKDYSDVVCTSDTSTVTGKRIIAVI